MLYWPQRRRIERMRKRILIGAAALLLAAVWIGGQMLGPSMSDVWALRQVSRDLGVSVRGGTVLSHEDTHSAMSDGNTLTVVSFSDDHCFRSVQGNGDWKPLPLTENLSLLVYGSQSRGPWLKDDEGKNPIPVITEGYYFFRDRNSEAVDPDSDLDIFHRYSYNFTVGLYDAGTDTLYYLKADT